MVNSLGEHNISQSSSADINNIQKREKQEKFLQQISFTRVRSKSNKLLKSLKLKKMINQKRRIQVKNFKIHL
jgi:hypothetical protein